MIYCTTLRRTTARRSAFLHQLWSSLGAAPAPPAVAVLGAVFTPGEGPGWVPGSGPVPGSVPPPGFSAAPPLGLHDSRRQLAGRPHSLAARPGALRPSRKDGLQNAQRHLGNSHERRHAGAEDLGSIQGRTLMGESLFLTYFRATSPGEVGFAGSYPGRIQPFHLDPGRASWCSANGFLFAESTVQLNIALVKSWEQGFFGGEDSSSKS